MPTNLTELPAEPELEPPPDVPGESYTGRENQLERESPSPSGTAKQNFIGSLFMVGQPLLLNAISIPATALIIRGMGELQYGDWATAASLIAAVSSLASFGIRSLFVRSVAQKPEEAERSLGEQLSLRGILSLFAGALAVLATLALGHSDMILGCVAIAAVSLVLSSLSSALGDVMQAYQRFQAFSIVNLVSGLLLTAASVLAVALGYGPIGLMWAYTLGPLVSLVLFYGLVRKQFFPPSFRWDLPRFGALLKDARVVGFHGIFSSVTGRVEQLVVPVLGGRAEMGYFSAGLMIASRLEMVPDGIAGAFFPQISRKVTGGEKEASRSVASLIVVTLVACLPFVLLTMAVAEPLAMFFFKRDPLVCARVMQITVWSLLLEAFYYPIYTSMTACGRHSEASKRVIGSTAISMGISLLMIYFFGLLGACGSWVIRQGITVAFLIPGFVRAYPSALSQVPMGHFLLSGGVMAGVLWGFQTLPVSRLLSLGLGGGVALLAYFAALASLKVIDVTELKAMLRRQPKGIH